ncbi:MAG: YdbH domain-containing protein [Sphingomonadales bacterium]|nr:YdbH domain-containing protein [Sphingomonadales bacterium]
MDAGAAQSDVAAMRRAGARRWPWLLGGALVAAALFAWSQRERLADREIAQVLHDAGIAARWKIAAIGLHRQLLTDVIVGDPAHPDLTIARIETETGLVDGRPALIAVTLVSPRLRGSWRGGRFSLGSLDRLFTGPSSGPFRLPDAALRVIDGQGMIVGDRGTLGFGLDGGGGLRNGFVAALTMTSRALSIGGCSIGDARLPARLRISDERPRLEGTLVMADLAAPRAGLRIAAARLLLDVRASRMLDAADLRLGGGLRELGTGALRVGSATGDLQLAIRRGALAGRYRVALGNVAGADAIAPTLVTEGSLRGDLGDHFTADGTWQGRGLAPDATGRAMLDRLSAAARGSPVAPIAARIVAVLLRETPQSRSEGTYVLRQNGRAASLMLPVLRYRGSAPEPLLTVSRLGAARAADGGLHLSGGFVTGGGLPVVSGAIAAGGAVRLAIAPYRAGDAMLAVPRLDLALAPGRLDLSGEAQLSGPLPGGEVRGLQLPIEGRWTKAGGLQLWPGCTRIGFDSLALASLALTRNALTLCPRAGAAIVTTGASGTRLAAGAAALDLAGTLGGAPLHAHVGPWGLALLPGRPGSVMAEGASVELGAGTPSRFVLANLTARLGPGAGASGSFSGGAVSLAPVPLDLTAIAGKWRYADGALELGDTVLRVSDRDAAARFNPLVARAAQLRLVDGTITASALLREPKSDRPVARVAIRHALAAATGHADLSVDALGFDPGLQPVTLSPLLLGVIADARGTITGAGAIDWADGTVTSHGTFTTARLDFAAAFGPVKGASGTVTFTDLLGLVTAPHQTVRVAAINPGIEVDDGVVTFAMLAGHVLAIEGAQWPFLDGELTLAPTRMTLGASEVRRYEMRVAGVDAARFLARLNMSNISATGHFDGQVPLVFDDAGGRIEHGQLTARPPGGTVSYIGALSYKDLSPMANFAFETLKSLNYRQLSVGLDGPLAGDILTRISMSGVTQGRGAKRNFLTRQIAKLPLQFNVNVRAPFYSLFTNLRGLYDPSYVADPRALGLIGADGRRLEKSVQGPDSAAVPQPPPN